MLSFALIMLAKRGALEDYPYVKQYALQLASRDSFQRTMRLEANHDQSIWHFGIVFQWPSNYLV